MRKIADADELERELRRLLDYASSHQPSRGMLASELQQLSLRVAQGTTSWKAEKINQGGSTEHAVIHLTDRQLSGVRALGPALRAQGLIGEFSAIQSMKNMPDGRLKLFPKGRANSDWDSIVLTPLAGTSSGGSTGLPGAKRALVEKQLAAYGYSLSANDEIERGGKNLSVIVEAKGSRLQVRQPSGSLLWSGNDIGDFVESFWFAKKLG